MGNMGSSYDDSCPPGGALISLQDGQICIAGKPNLRDSQKPSELASLPDQTWKKFAGTVGQACGRCIDERLPFLGVILCLVPFVTAVLNIMSEDSPLPFGVGIACFAAGFATIWGGRVLICNLNQRQDQVIRTACQELSTSSGGAFSAEYRTRWTGPCKPKNARTIRLIAISPGGPGPIMTATPQSIQVTVPPGVTAGAVLQVQTPSGIANATVPPGVNPGETFTFVPTALPAPVVVQAQVVGASPPVVQAQVNNMA